jgi:hypothetical protein
MTTIKDALHHPVVVMTSILDKDGAPYTYVGRVVSIDLDHRFVTIAVTQSEEARRMALMFGGYEGPVHVFLNMSNIASLTTISEDTYNAALAAPMFGGRSPE